MTRLKFFIVLGVVSFLLPVFSVAQNYFHTGTEWLVKISSTDPNYNGYSLYYYSLEQEQSDSDLLKLCIREENSTQSEILLLIFSEDEKVYFKTSSSDSRKYLMYDFSLQPGEGTYVWSAGDYIASNNHPLNKFYIKCTDIKPLEENPEIKRMILREFSDETEETEIFPANWEWYKGIGGITGPEWNTLDLLLGGKQEVCRVISDGETLFDLNNYELSGIKQLVTKNPDNSTSYFTVDGKYVTSPKKGNLYIQIKGGEHSKVII